MSVSRAGQPVALEPKTFDVLRYLIEHRDRLVTKEELLDTVWKDTFVTPNVLTRAVAQLRKAIGDDAFEARYVETVAKRGYRFIATVEPLRRSTPRRFPPLALCLCTGPPARRRWVVAGNRRHHRSRRGCRARSVCASRTAAACITSSLSPDVLAAALHDGKPFVFVPVDLPGRPYCGVHVESVTARWRSTLRASLQAATSSRLQTTAGRTCTLSGRPTDSGSCTTRAKREASGSCRRAEALRDRSSISDRRRRGRPTASASCSHPTLAAWRRSRLSGSCIATEPVAGS